MFKFKDMTEVDEHSIQTLVVRVNGQARPIDVQDRPLKSGGAG
ncbi:MAG: hypothetical protein WA990_11675 [Rubrobacteraceae bacterium]